MVSGDTCLFDQTLQQVLPETRRMRNWKSDVLVEMEHLNTTPVDPRLNGQCIQEFKLRRSGRGYDSSDPPLAYGSPNRSCGMSRRRSAQRILVRKNFNLCMRHR